MVTANNSSDQKTETTFIIKDKTEKSALFELLIKSII